MLEKLKKEINMFLADRRIDRAMHYGKLEKAIRYAAETNYNDFKFIDEAEGKVQKGHFVFLFAKDKYFNIKVPFVYIVKDVENLVERKIEESEGDLLVCKPYCDPFEVRPCLRYYYDGKIKEKLIEIFVDTLNYYKEEYQKSERKRIQEFENLI